MISALNDANICEKPGEWMNESEWMNDFHSVIQSCSHTIAGIK